MSELSEIQDRIDHLLSECVLKTCDVMKLLGHKTLQCFDCHKETDINELINGVGRCEKCRTRRKE